jgi:hypothetical protein
MKKELLKVMKKEKYGKKYFESINYVNYLDRKNKYKTTFRKCKFIKPKF